MMTRVGRVLAGIEYTAIGVAALAAGALIVAAVIPAGEIKTPNPALTPGAVRTTSAAEACARPLPARPDRVAWMMLKQEAMRRYGLPLGDAGDYELDHLIPRGLGGADVIADLWPQKWPAARRKDEIEVRMTRDFCANDRSDDGLVALQAWFAAGKWRDR